VPSLPNDKCAAGLKVEVDRQGQLARPDTTESAKCRTCVRADDERCRR
jgi:hypothetical protein